MNLATRCTACGTIFRVVQDQLRISEGWVRCGRCAEVFDAREQLFDLEREAAPPWPPAGAPPQPEATQPSADTEAPDDLPSGWHAPPMPAPAPQPWPEEPPAPPPPPTPPPPPPPTPAPAPVAQPEEEWPVTVQQHDPELERRREPYLTMEPAAPEAEDDGLPVPKGWTPPEAADGAALADSAAPDVLLSPSLAAAAAGQGQARASETPTAADPDGAPATPGFVRQAQRRARWQRPGVRLALGAAGLLLLGALALQLARHQRDALAAQYPKARPALQTLCQWLACEIRPWKQITGLHVESSGLVQEGSGHHYRLSLSLRNQSPWELALPWVDLSVQDAAGKPVARRMLSPQDFGMDGKSIAPGAEQSLQLVFESGEQAVAGYSIEIFQPAGEQP